MPSPASRGLALLAICAIVQVGCNRSNPAELVKADTNTAPAKAQAELVKEETGVGGPDVELTKPKAPDAKTAKPPADRLPDTSATTNALALHRSWERPGKFRGTVTRTEVLKFTDRVVEICITWKSFESQPFCRQGVYSVEEQDGRQVLLIEGQDGKSTVTFQVDGDKLILNGMTPGFSGLGPRDISGEWRRVP